MLDCACLRREDPGLLLQASGKEIGDRLRAHRTSERQSGRSQQEDCLWTIAYSSKLTYCDKDWKMHFPSAGLTVVLLLTCVFGYGEARSGRFDPIHLSSADGIVRPSILQRKILQDQQTSVWTEIRDGKVQTSVIPVAERNWEPKPEEKNEGTQDSKVALKKWEPKTEEKKEWTQDSKVAEKTWEPPAEKKEWTQDSKVTEKKWAPEASEEKKELSQDSKVAEKKWVPKAEEKKEWTQDSKVAEKEKWHQDSKVGENVKEKEEAWKPAEDSKGPEEKKEAWKPAEDSTVQEEKKEAWKPAEDSKVQEEKKEAWKPAEDSKVQEEKKKEAWKPTEDSKVQEEKKKEVWKPAQDSKVQEEEKKEPSKSAHDSKVEKEEIKMESEKKNLKAEEEEIKVESEKKEPWKPAQDSKVEEIKVEDKKEDQKSNHLGASETEEKAVAYQKEAKSEDKPWKETSVVVEKPKVEEKTQNVRVEEKEDAKVKEKEDAKVEDKKTAKFEESKEEPNVEVKEEPKVELKEEELKVEVKEEPKWNAKIVESNGDDKEKEQKLEATAETKFGDNKDEPSREEQKAETKVDGKKDLDPKVEEQEALQQQDGKAENLKVDQKNDNAQEKEEKSVPTLGGNEADKLFEAKTGEDEHSSGAGETPVESDEDYPDFLDELRNFPERFQKTAERLKDHIRYSGLDKYSTHSKELFNQANQQIQESFTPLLGKDYAPLIAYVVSYGLLLLPLALVTYLLEKVRAIFSLQKVLLFMNIYLSAYFAALLVAAFILHSEPMDFFMKYSTSSYIFLQLLQAFGYLVYLLLNTVDLLSTCSVGRIAAKFSAALQWVVVVAVGFHYYVTVFHRAMARKAPLTSWKIYGLYSVCFMFLCLFARIERGKKQYTPLEEDDITDKKN